MPLLELSDEEVALIKARREKPEKKRGRPKGRKNFTPEERREKKAKRLAERRPRLSEDEKIAREKEALERKYESLKMGEAYHEIHVYPARDSVLVPGSRNSDYRGATVPRVGFDVIGDGCLWKRGRRTRWS